MWYNHSSCDILSFCADTYQVGRALNKAVDNNSEIFFSFPLNPVALRMAKTPYRFGHPESIRVNTYAVTPNYNFYCFMFYDKVMIEWRNTELLSVPLSEVGQVPLCFSYQGKFLYIWQKCRFL